MYKKFSLFRKKDHLHSLIIFKVIGSKKYSYFNLKKQLFQNNLPVWAHSRVPNIAQIWMGGSEVIDSEKYSHFNAKK